MDGESIETPKFIYSQFIEDVTLADRIVEFFHAHPYLHIKGGVTNTSGEVEVFGPEDIEYTTKKSTEIVIYKQLGMFPVFRELNQHIQKVLLEYLNIYPKCNSLAKFSLVPYQIQYYEPGEGYLEWHCETPSGVQPYISRVLTFQLNCNTIEDEGGTEFLHQDFISKSEKGKLTIFPPDWTFTHRGLPSTKEKMIVTGWWNFEGEKLN